jgi:hypothetical protein
LFERLMQAGQVDADANLQHGKQAHSIGRGWACAGEPPAAGPAETP